jgi:hypothetical protein
MNAHNSAATPVSDGNKLAAYLIEDALHNQDSRLAMEQRLRLRLVSCAVDSPDLTVVGLAGRWVFTLARRGRRIVHHLHLRGSGDAYGL